jgi:2-keto-4-pentenoate hydratase
VIESVELVVDQAAERLLGAYRSGQPTTPVRDLIGSTDIALAYKVQQRIVAARTDRGAAVVGRKIGLTSEAVQRQVGVDQPDFGVLLDDMQFVDGAVIPSSLLLQPRAEAEVAFVLRADLDGKSGLAAIRDAIAYASPAIEVVDSRVRDWDIAITDTVADNASSGVFVIGEARLELSEFEPRDVAMTLTRDGIEVSSGSGVACLGDPLNAVAWLASTASMYGASLRAGDVILSGALGPLARVEPGWTLMATILPLGTVTVTFGEAEST